MRGLAGTSADGLGRWLAQGLALLLGLAAALSGCPTRPETAAPGSASHPAEGAGSPGAGPGEAQRPVMRLGSVGGRAELLDELVHDRLLRVDAESAILPGVLSAWTEPEPLTWRFEIRQGVTFHEHPCLPAATTDRQVTARDVVYSLERAARSVLGELPIRGMDAWLAGKDPRIFGIQAEGRDAVRIVLQRPAAFLLHRLAEVPVLPWALKRCADAAATARPVGTGPFRLSASPPAAGEVELVRNDVYWERAGLAGRLPLLGGVRVLSLPDGKALAEAVAAGALDLAFLTPGEAVGLIADPVARRPALVGELGLDPAAVEPFVDVRQREAALVVLAFRLREGRDQLGDERVRRAIAHAIRRSDFRPLDPALLTPTTRYLHAEMAGYEAARPQLQYDWDLSRSLLVETGLPVADWPPLDVAIPPRFAAMAPALAEQLERVGLSTHRVAAGAPADLEVRLVAGGLTGREPWPFLASLAEDLPAAGLGSPDLDELLAQVDMQPDAGIRAQLYDRIEEWLLQSRALVPISRKDPYTPSRFGLAAPNVEGVFDRDSRHALVFPGAALAHASLRAPAGR